MHLYSGDKYIINDTFWLLSSLLCVHLVQWLFTEVVKILLQCFTTTCSTELIFLRGLCVWPQLFTEVQPSQFTRWSQWGYHLCCWTFGTRDQWETKRKQILRLEAEFWDWSLLLNLKNFTWKSQKICLHIYAWFSGWDFKSQNFPLLRKSVMKPSRTVVELLETEAFNWFSHQP